MIPGVHGNGDLFVNQSLRVDQVFTLLKVQVTAREASQALPSVPASPQQLLSLSSGLDGIVGSLELMCVVLWIGEASLYIMLPLRSPHSCTSLFSMNLGLLKSDIGVISFIV